MSESVSVRRITGAESRLLVPVSSAERKNSDFSGSVVGWCADNGKCRIASSADIGDSDSLAEPAAVTREMCRLLPLVTFALEDCGEVLGTPRCAEDDVLRADTD